MKRHFGKWLTAAALAVGCTVMTANAFADTDGHWAESAINKWSGEYGIIQGYDDGTFRPDKSITRGAFAGILDRFLHFQHASPADTFSDTAGTYWEDAILKLHASGIYLGNQGAALPSSTITRQQAVAMIGRAFRIAPETAAPDYTDTDQIAEYAMAYVGEFEARGYLTDSAAGTFRPTDPITRAELINILSNMVDTLVKETTTVTEDVSGSLLISAADGATLKGIRIGGDLILAPGVTKDVTLVDCVIQGNIRNYGTGEVRFEAPQITPESTAAKPSEVYKPGATLDRTLEYGGKTVPIYRDRPLNVFSDVDFIWTGEENENQRRLEYLGGEFRTRYGIDVSSFQGEIDWDAVADDNIDFAMVRVGFRGTGTGSLNTDKHPGRYAGGSGDRRVLLRPGCHRGGGHRGGGLRHQPAGRAGHQRPRGLRLGDARFHLPGLRHVPGNGYRLRCGLLRADQGRGVYPHGLRRYVCDLHEVRSGRSGGLSELVS